MPTYDYHCQACGHDFSAMHKISDDAPVCPECGGSVQKRLSAPAIHGRGSIGKPPTFEGNPGGCVGCCHHKSH